MKFLISLVALCFALTGFANVPLPAPQTIPGAKTVSTDELLRLRTEPKDIVMIDTRRLQDYATGHLPGAINIPAHLVREELPSKVENATTRVVFYCGGKDCIRASVGVNEALDQGYTNVFYYYGGLTDWIRSELPVESKQN